MLRISKLFSFQYLLQPWQVILISKSYFTLCSSLITCLQFLRPFITAVLWNCLSKAETNLLDILKRYKWNKMTWKNRKLTVFVFPSQLRLLRLCDFLIFISLLNYFKRFNNLQNIMKLKFQKDWYNVKNVKIVYGNIRAENYLERQTVKNSNHIPYIFTDSIFLPIWLMRYCGQCTDKYAFGFHEIRLKICLLCRVIYQ